MDPMTAVRRRLDDERAQTLRRLADLTDDYGAVVAASRDTNADDEHDPEGATIAFERSQADHAADSARRRLAAVESALRRVDDGTYGVCEVCGGPIGDGRLDALPAATRCVRCAAVSAR